MILQTAAQAFMERGYAATSIDEIADRLGATKGRIYHYYRTKADIFLDVHRKAMELMLKTIHPVAAVDEDASERLYAMARAHALLIMNSLEYQRVAVQGLERHIVDMPGTRQHRELRYIISMRDEFEQLYADVIDEGIASGHFRAVDARLITKPMLGGLNWLAVWYSPRTHEPQSAREHIADEMASYLVNGLRSNDAA